MLYSIFIHVILYLGSDLKFSVRLHKIEASSSDVDLVDNHQIDSCVTIGLILVEIEGCKFLFFPTTRSLRRQHKVQSVTWIDVFSPHGRVGLRGRVGCVEWRWKDRFLYSDPHGTNSRISTNSSRDTRKSLLEQACVVSSRLNTSPVSSKPLTMMQSSRTLKFSLQFARGAK